MTARINAMRTKQSAYFPSSIESSVGDDQVLETNKKHQDRLSHVTILSSGGISFPYNASVLWNRETVSFPKQLISQNTISPLLLCPNDIAFVLQCIQSNKSIASGNLLVSATQYHHLSENQKYMIGCPVLGIPRYMFSSDGNTGDHLTIPITNIQDNKMLLFEESSTL